MHWRETWETTSQPVTPTTGCRPFVMGYTASLADWAARDSYALSPLYNHECAGAFREIAVVLAQEGAPVTSRSEYARGAQAEEAVAQDVARLARTSRLQSVLGIGPTLADPSPN